MIRPLALFFCLVFFALPARADTYIKPTWPDLIRTMVHFNALDINESALLDEYGAIAECELYDKFFSDDFKWNSVRTAMQDELKAHAAEYPVHYGFISKMQLSRYDFDTKQFMFTGASAVDNVNSIVFFEADSNACYHIHIKYLPKAFRALIERPIYVLGLPMQPQDAKALLRLMQSENNLIRVVYARFNLTLTYADEFRKNMQQNGALMNWSQPGHAANDPFQFDARLDSADFYADEALTEHIYTFVPQ